MNLSGSTSLWLQTVQPSVYSWSWADFVAIVCARFDRDEHNHLIIQFFHVRQLSDVTKYVELFSDITHQILAHDPNLAPSVITNRFIDGLKKEIKAVVMVHRPQNLNSTVLWLYCRKRPCWTMYLSRRGIQIPLEGDLIGIPQELMGLPLGMPQNFLLVLVKRRKDMKGEETRMKTD